MIFFLISVVVPVLIYLLVPVIIKRITGKSASTKIFLAIACFLFLISWYLPSPLIEGRATSFTTHFVGGGLFTGFLWLHIAKQIKWRGSIVANLFTIYLLVCALGVTNELFEFILVRLRSVHLNPSDTWWDLIANTSGAMLFWIGYTLWGLNSKS